MSLTQAAYLCLFAPVIGTIVIALLGLLDRVKSGVAAGVGVAAVGLSFVGALGALAKMPKDDHGELITVWSWLSAGGLSISFDLWIDQLAVFEMLVVSGVGFLIIVYSVGYMHGDPQKRRFFAYMSLFIFSMLMLVMAGNLVFLLVGWGLVGMASYLLIGFHHDRPSAVAASKKAFIVNAIGDVSIMVGIFLLWVKTSALTYPAIFDGYQAAVAQDSRTALLIALLLLGGGLAKSAQLPLHTWLPDAMEGPTPVSALIHAATMVTAGVYLVARFWMVFEWSWVAHLSVAVIGGLTLLVAGLIALVQTDIKRVIAYSTMSQIGYMFLAVGLGAYSAAMFHLMTHAFFKALLFLAAGVVIHAVHDEQDIRKMGGLRKYMPKTYGLFLVASLALAGIIPFSGFFSKDEILVSAFYADTSIHYLLWAGALLGAFMTGLYTFRLVFQVFHGDEGEATKQLAAASDDAHAHAGEAPRSMMWPLWVLGVLTVVAGVVAIPGGPTWLVDYLHHSLESPIMLAIEEAIHDNLAVVWALSLLLVMPIALAGIFVARQIWLTGSWKSMRTMSPGFERVLQAGFGFDALYDRVLYRPAAAVASWCGNVMEAQVMTTAMQSVVGAVRSLGGAASVAQNGLLRRYAAATMAAVIAIVFWYVGAKG